MANALVASSGLLLLACCALLCSAPPRLAGAAPESAAGEKVASANAATGAASAAALTPSTSIGPVVAPAAHWVYCPAGSSPDAPLIFGLHGWSSSADDWMYARPIANRLGWCMVAWDAPGTRFPPDPAEWPEEPWSLSDFADAAIDLLDYLGRQKALFLGVSWGAATATQIALRHPDRVIGIVAGGVGQGEPPLNFSEEEVDVIRERIMRCQSGDEAAWEEARPEHDAAFYPGTRESVDYTWTKHTRSFRLPSNMIMLDTIRGIDFRPELAAIHDSGDVELPPALFVSGDSDGHHSVESVHRLREAYGPQAQATIYLETGHIVQHERRAEFHDAVVTFAESVIQSDA